MFIARHFLCLLEIIILCWEVTVVAIYVKIWRQRNAQPQTIISRPGNLVLFVSTYMYSDLLSYCHTKLLLNIGKTGLGIVISMYSKVS